MTKVLLSTVLAAASLVVAGPAFAATGSTATASGVAVANIVSAITLVHTPGTSLNFGTFDTGTGGTVVVTTAGAGSTTGDVAFVTGTVEAADQFLVKGDSSRSFTITTASGTVVNGATSIPFTTTPSAASSALSLLGISTFSVGGTLTLAGTEPAGSYNGSYNATVTYN